MKYSYPLRLVLFYVLGCCGFSSTLFAQSSQVLNQTGDMVRVIYPGGGTLDEGGANTGAIKITLPQTFENSYIRFKVEIYSNDAGFEAQRATLWLSGYALTNNFGRWSAPAAELVSSSLAMDIPVYFGDDAGGGQRKPVVWIGDQDQYWFRLKAHVVEVMVVGADDNTSLWDDGWAMSVDTGDRDPSNWPYQKVSNILPISKPNQTFEDGGQVSRFTNPVGGLNKLSGNGSVKITLPRGNSGSELRIRVELFNYVSGGQSESATVWLAGRNNSTWEGASAQIVTTSSDLALPVYFGYDGNPSAAGTRAIIWLGDQDEAWGDLHIHVAEVLSGRDNDPLNMNNSPWTIDWDIALDDGARDGLSYQDVTATLPLGTSTLWQSDGDDVVFTDGSQVAIGLADPGAFRLAVDGDIKARRVKVTAEDWPDYVFEAGYELRDLQTLQAYLDQHGHLPEVPSKAEAEQNGVYVNDMQVVLLRKVEELTLYTIDQQEQIQQLQEQIKTLMDQQSTAEK
ncbi:MAG: hypothetical protein AAFZ63_23825 [Bacteroidota bacterium]